MSAAPDWFLPIIASALCLGFYDVTKKHAVNGNSVMYVLFFSTLCGSAAFVAATAVSGHLSSAIACTQKEFLLIAAKSLLVSSSWVCVYYAMRELPISIAAPVRSSSPLWTFIGSLVIFNEVPSGIQALAMAAVFFGYFALSLIGKTEGFSIRNSKGLHLIFAGTLLGSASALYDKFLLGSLHISHTVVQFYFSIDLVVILGLACLLRKLFGKSKYEFAWRWSIPATGILLIVADLLYFYSLGLADARISILSLIRRSGVIVSFTAGSLVFHDKYVLKKAVPLAFILAGVAILAVVK